MKIIDEERKLSTNNVLKHVEPKQINMDQDSNEVIQESSKEEEFDN